MRTTLEQRQQMADLYSSGISVVQIAKRFGVHHETVLQAKKQFGVPSRKVGRYRTYTLNERCFDDLTPEAMYWLGFMFSDGHVAQSGATKKYMFSVGLAESDKGHLEKFKEFLGSNHPVRTSSNERGFGSGKLSKIAIDSKPIHARLSALGMCNKSFCRVAPALCTSSPYFWRGVIDGDGSLMAVAGGKPRPRLELCGGKEICEQFREFAITVAPHTTASVRRRGVHLFNVSFATDAARRIVRALYGSEGPRLERKGVIAVEIMSQNTQRVRNRDLTGKQFFRLTAIERVIVQGKTYARHPGRRTKWLCRCICGNEKLIFESDLVNGDVKSCGCYQFECRHKTGSQRYYASATPRTRNESGQFLPLQ